MRHIDIIIRVRDNPEELTTCLASLFGVMPEIAHLAPRVTAINPCWDRPDVDALLRAPMPTAPGIEVIMTSEGAAGFGVLSSLLRRSAADRRDALVLMSDTIWFTGSLGAMVKAAQSGDGIGLVSPRTAGAAPFGLPLGGSEGTAAPSSEEAHGRFLTLAKCLPHHRTAASCLTQAHLVTGPLLAALCNAQPDPGAPLPLGPDLAPEACRWGYAAVLANQAFVHCRSDAEGGAAETGAAALAESILGGLLPDANGRWSLVVDWSDTAGHHGDGGRDDVPAIRALAENVASGLRVSVMCPEAVFRFHALDQCAGLRHVAPGSPGRHAVALRLKPPADSTGLARFHRLAPLSLCVAPATLGRLEARGGQAHGMWRDLARHATAVLLTSAGEKAFFDGQQHPQQPARSHLLPCPASLATQRIGLSPVRANHLLVMGDEADAMANRLHAAFPALPLVCVGVATQEAPGWRSHRADATSPASMGRLISQSHAIVIAGLESPCSDRLLQVLGAGKPLVMQRSAGLEEMVSNYHAASGVFMYDNATEAEAMLRAALAQGSSLVDDTPAPGWGPWAAGVADLSRGLLQSPGLLAPLEDRLAASAAAACPASNEASARAGATDLEHLLAHEDEDFVQMAYWTFLNRQADPDGATNFLYALHTGKSKLDIIDMIQGSPEGLLVGAQLARYIPLARSGEVMPKRIVLVLGMHRSGTSALTRGLQVLGVELGSNLYPPRPGENPKGYFEDADISNFDDQVLASIGRDWQHFGQLDAALVDGLRQSGMFAKAVELLRAKSEGKAVLGVKDPRISKLLPFWQPVFSELGLDQSFVLAVRNPRSVARSLEVRNGFSRQKSYILWLDHTLGSLEVVGRHRFAITDYDHLLSQPESALRTIARRLDLYLSASALQEYAGEFLDSSLRHAEFGDDELGSDSACFPLVREVYARLQQLALDNPQADRPEFLRVIAGWKADFAVLRTSLDWVEGLAADNQRLRQALGSVQAVSQQALAG